MRGIMFYIVVALVAAVMIWISLGPGASAPPVTRQGGQQMADHVLFDARALAHADRRGPEHVSYIAHEETGGAFLGLRLAVKADMGPPTPAETGVRLMLDPGVAQTIAERGARVEVDINPIGVTTAKGLALSLQYVGAVEWVSQDLQPIAQTVTYDLPPSFVGGLPEAIGFRAISENNDYAYGWEIRALRLRPL